MAQPASSRVVLAHGFTQTARSWEGFAGLLGARLPEVDVIAVDLPGHASATEVQAGDLWSSAEHLVRNGGRGMYVGYSMGGRVALHAAIARPEFVDRMVLIGATAGIDDDKERDARRSADERLADHIEAVGVESFIDEWLAKPLFADLGTESAQRDDRLRNTAAGLATSLRTTGTGTQESLWARLGEIQVPTLVLAGTHDTKFTELGRRLSSSIPDATFVAIDEAGHSVHLEQPEATVEAIVDWLGPLDAP